MILGEKTEARLKVIKERFEFNKKYDEGKLLREISERTKKDSLDQERRDQRRRKLAMQTRDF